VKLQFRAEYAPRGPNKSAQGKAKWRFATSDALGNVAKNAKALKGRNNKFQFCVALSGLRFSIELETQGVACG
jgi:hypothetical protein